MHQFPHIVALPDVDNHNSSQTTRADEVADETHIAWDEEERDEDIQKAIRSAQDG